MYYKRLYVQPYARTIFSFLTFKASIFYPSFDIVSCRCRKANGRPDRLLVERGTLHLRLAMWTVMWWSDASLHHHLCGTRMLLSGWILPRLERKLHFEGSVWNELQTECVLVRMSKFMRANVRRPKSDLCYGMQQFKMWMWYGISSRYFNCKMCKSWRLSRENDRYAYVPSEFPLGGVFWMWALMRQLRSNLSIGMWRSQVWMWWWILSGHINWHLPYRYSMSR